MSEGADTRGNALFAALTAGVTLPNVDLTGSAFTIPDGARLYQEVARLENDDLTTGQVNGTGVFDALMGGFAAHLKEEYSKGRITGAEYTKAFVALTEAAMANATQFVLGREAAYWQSVQAQIAAVTGKIEHETAKLRCALVRIQALGEQANVGLTKLKMATEAVTYGQGKFQLDHLLPLQQAGVELENSGRGIQNQTASYNLASVLPLQVAKLGLENEGQTLRNAGQDLQNEQVSYTLGNLLPQQLTLLREQTEVQRAQTADARTDASPVVGLIGRQKDLYAQQINSYKRDIEIKATKLWTDAWITMKTIDEGLMAPDNFSNQTIDSILDTLKANIPMGEEE